jgi:hypothetical protein
MGTGVTKLNIYKADAQRDKLHAPIATPRGLAPPVPTPRDATAREQQLAWRTPRQPRQPDEGDDEATLVRAIAREDSLLAEDVEDAELFKENHEIGAVVSGNLSGEAEKEAVPQSHLSVWEAPRESGLQNSVSVLEAAKSGKAWYQYDDDDADEGVSEGGGVRDDGSPMHETPEAAAAPTAKGSAWATAKEAAEGTQGADARHPGGKTGLKAPAPAKLAADEGSSTVAGGAPSGMDSEMDELELFEEKEQPHIDAGVSVNLAGAANKEAATPSYASVWEAPKESGLDKSMQATQAVMLDRGWDQYDDDAAIKGAAEGAKAGGGVLSVDAQPSAAVGAATAIKGTTGAKAKEAATGKQGAKLAPVSKPQIAASAPPGTKEGPKLNAPATVAKNDKAVDDAKSNAALSGMGSEMDELELFEQKEQPHIDAGVSVNLAGAANKEPATPSYASMWEAPKESGLDNTMQTTEAVRLGRGWDQYDGNDAGKSAAKGEKAGEGGPSVAAQPSAAVAAATNANGTTGAKAKEVAKGTQGAKLVSGSKPQLAAAPSPSSKKGLKARAPVTGVKGGKAVTEVITKAAPPPAFESEMDEPDLFEVKEQQNIDAGVCVHLAESANKRAATPSYDGVWEAPKQSGLQNSMEATEAISLGRGWDLDEDEEGTAVVRVESVRSQDGAKAQLSAKALGGPEKGDDAPAAAKVKTKSPPPSAVATAASTVKTEPPPPAAVDDLDDPDLFNDDEEIGAAVSGNLMREANKETVELSHHSVWEAPRESGLQNSMSVAEAAESGQGWYQYDEAPGAAAGVAEGAGGSVLPVEAKAERPGGARIATKAPAAKPKRAAGLVETAKRAVGAKSSPAGSKKINGKEAVPTAPSEPKSVKPAPALKAKPAPPIATEDELDDPDLFNEDEEIGAAVSGNLVGEANKETVELSHHSVWEAPKESGLQNSMSVAEAAEAGTGWYQVED